jgi:hypothetical protein
MQEIGAFMSIPISCVGLLSAMFLILGRYRIAEE